MRLGFDVQPSAGLTTHAVWHCSALRASNPCTPLPLPLLPQVYEPLYLPGVERVLEAIRASVAY